MFSSDDVTSQGRMINDAPITDDDKAEIVEYPIFKDTQFFLINEDFQMIK
jgi:hypothetical protein